MRILDLCCGRGGATRAFYDHGHEIVTVDINPKFQPTFCQDVNTFDSEGEYDLIWASPPCTEYSRCSLPKSWGCNRGTHPIPDMRPFLNCVRIVRETSPRYWVIENVRGAIPFFRQVIGEPRQRIGSRILWGTFPKLSIGRAEAYGKWRLPPTPDRAEIRSEIPYAISEALCRAIEKTEAE